MTNQVHVLQIVARSLIWVCAFVGTPLVMGVVIMAEQVVGVLSPVSGIVLIVALMAQIICLRRVWYPSRGWQEFFSALLMGITFSAVGLALIAILTLMFFRLEGIQ